MELSPRLFMLVNMIEAPAACLGDVGTDHGFLPVWAVSQGIARKAIASDINQGPLNRAADTVAAHGLQDKITLRLCSGLSGYTQGECDWTVIAGMGGHLICTILEAALENGGIQVGQQFVISPHTHESVVRDFLYRRGFRIDAEQACRDAGHVYLGIRCCYDGILRTLTPVDAAVGCQDILPKIYYDNLVRKARKRIGGLQAGTATKASLAEIDFLQAVIRKAEEK